MADLNLRIKVITDGANKLKGLGGNLGGIAKTAGIAVAAVSGVAVAGGVALAGMAAEAETAQTKLDSVFKSTKANAFTSIDALNKHATAMAAATTFDDDAVKGAQAALLSFGNITGEAFTDATEASADLAAFMGTDIPDAAKLLGKALAVPEAAAGRLARSGIILTEAQQSQIDKFVAAGDAAAAQGVILDAVGEKFGTVAEDLAGTHQGQITQAMNALGEAGESLGVILLPVFTLIAQGVKGLADFVVANMPLIQSVIGGVMTFITNLFNGAGSSLGGLQGLFQSLVAWVQENLPTMMSVAGQVFGAIGNIIRAVAPILIEVAKVLLPAIGIAASVLFKVLDVAFKGIGGAFEVLGNVFDTVSGFIEDTIAGVVGFVKGAWNAFAGVWNGIQISVPSVDIPFVGVVGGFSIGLPDLPMLAKGGIVNQPTLAVLGESGREAVIPLGRGMPGMGNQFTFHVQSPIPDEKGIVELVERSQRLTGMLQWNGAEG